MSILKLFSAFSIFGEVILRNPRQMTIYDTKHLIYMYVWMTNT